MRSKQRSHLPVAFSLLRVDFRAALRRSVVLYLGVIVGTMVGALPLKFMRVETTLFAGNVNADFTLAHERAVSADLWRGQLVPALAEPLTVIDGADAILCSERVNAIGRASQVRRIATPRIVALVIDDWNALSEPSVQRLNYPRVHQSVDRLLPVSEVDISVAFADAAAPVPATTVAVDLDVLEDPADFIAAKYSYDEILFGSHDSASGAGWWLEPFGVRSTSQRLALFYPALVAA